MINITAHIQEVTEDLVAAQGDLDIINQNGGEKELPQAFEAVNHIIHNCEEELAKWINPSRSQND